MSTGAGGSIIIGSNTYCVEQWALANTNELQDVTTTCSGGWVERNAGYSSASMSCSLFLNGSASALAAAVAQFAPGTAITAVLPVGNSAKGYTGTFLVGSANLANPAKTTPKLDVSAESSGAVTFGALT